MADGGKSPVTRRDGAADTGRVDTMGGGSGATGSGAPKDLGAQGPAAVSPSSATATSKAGTGAGKNGTGAGRSSAATEARTIRPGRLTDIALPPPPPPHAMAPPGLASPFSSSLPSTPYVHARKLSDDYRTPPPAARAALEAVSTPRSARSESDTGTVRPSARAASASASASHGCRFETGMAFSRRRIPYSLGGDVLEPATKVKKVLEPDEERKLSGDMRELYDRLLPSADGEERRGRFVRKLERILKEKWPGQELEVHVFGSSGNLLCSNDSDVDICITTSMKALQRVCNLAKALADQGMERVVCVPNAKVPIVKIWDPELKLACDMNVNNTLALDNTRMVRTYVQIDPRVRPLAMVIKHWTRRRILNDAALGGTLSSYSWICMIINFLQTRSPPVLPNLQGMPERRTADAQGRIPPFVDDLDALRGFGDANKETLGELMFHFFRRHGHEIDFEKNVISIRTGSLISKHAKKWHLMQNNRLCIEEPFNTERNLGNTADDISFRGMHLEIRRAFELISQAKLEECCEEYVFPPPEEKTWTKPAPQPRPILTRSLSQQGRGPRANNNASSNRQPNKSRTGPSNRRASSATAMNKLPPFSIGPASAPLQPPHERLSGSQIHAQLFHHFQLLQAQEQQLRLQMEQRAQQAQLSAHAAAHLQPIQIPHSAMPQQTTFEGLRPPASIEPGPLSAPLRGVQNPYYALHMTPQLQGQRFAHQPAMPSQSSTNPPSPTLPTMQTGGDFASRNTPRSHRGLTANEDNSSVRSHSQPPGNGMRGSAPRPPRHAGGQYPQNMPQGHLVGQSTLAHFQQLYLQAKMAADAQHQHHQHQHQHHHHQQQQHQQHQQHQQRSQTHSPQTGSPRQRAMHPDQMDGSGSGRYLGYCVDPTAPYTMPVNGLEANGVPFMHLPNEAGSNASRPRRASVSPSITRVRSHTPRSGSPSNSTVTSEGGANYFPAFSLSVATSNPTSGASSDAVTSPPAQPASAAVQYPSRSGPLILDGSDETDYTPPRELSARHNGASSLPNDPPSYTLNFSVSPQKSPARADAQTPKTPPQQSPQSSTVLQFGDFPARATLRSTSRANRSASSAAAGDAEAKSFAFPKVAISDRAAPPAAGLGIELASESASEQVLKLATPQKPVQPHDDSGAESEDRAPAFLSPVREVRTPSPTVTRAAVAAAKSRRAESTGSPTRAAAAHPLSPVRNGVPAQPRPVSFSSLGSIQAQQPPVPTPLATGAWQQSVSKKARKGRKASSTGAATLVSEVERKGG